MTTLYGTVVRVVVLQRVYCPGIACRTAPTAGVIV
jgi:hypothetical protein